MNSNLKQLSDKFKPGQVWSTPGSRYVVVSVVDKAQHQIGSLVVIRRKGSCIGKIRWRVTGQGFPNDILVRDI